MKEKQIYVEAYLEGDMKLRDDALPIFPAFEGLCTVTEAYLMKCGKVERDGEELEFQEVRIYVKPVKPKG